LRSTVREEMESSRVMAVTSSNATGIPLCEAASESHAMISGVLNPDKMVDRLVGLLPRLQTLLFHEQMLCCRMKSF
jgi:hypothetical protein